MSKSNRVNLAILAIILFACKYWVNLLLFSVKGSKIVIDDRDRQNEFEDSAGLFDRGEFEYELFESVEF